MPVSPPHITTLNWTVIEENKSNATGCRIAARSDDELESDVHLVYHIEFIFFQRIFNYLSRDAFLGKRVLSSLN